MLFPKINEHISGNRNQFYRLIVVGAGIIGILLIPHGYLFDSGNSICIHYRLFGVKCPFCGATRAIYQLLHFEFLSAVQLNPAVLSLALYFALDFLTFLKPAKNLIRLRKTAFYLVLASFLLLYLSRLACI